MPHRLTQHPLTCHTEVHSCTAQHSNISPPHKHNPARFHNVQCALHIAPYTTLLHITLHPSAQIMSKQAIASNNEQASSSSSARHQNRKSAAFGAGRPGSRIRGHFPPVRPPVSVVYTPRSESCSGPRSIPTCVSIGLHESALGAHWKRKEKKNPCVHATCQRHCSTAPSFSPLKTAQTCAYDPRGGPRPGGGVVTWLVGGAREREFQD